MSHSTRGKLSIDWVGKGKSLRSGVEGQYGYEWADRSDPRVGEVRVLSTQRRIGESGGQFGATENLLVAGENLDVLRALNRTPELADKYMGKIKLCYIDPPFNTGGVFGTHYDDALEHSIWLTMMDERLRLIQPLLSKDGSIWVHVDENESHRMRMLLDEIFGIASFAGEIVWQKTYAVKMDAKHVPSSHDTIFVYRQRNGTWEPNLLKGKAKVKFPFRDAAGNPYATFPLRKWGANSLRSEAPSGWFPITSPEGKEVWPVRPDGRDGTWRWSRKKMREAVSLIEWKADRNGTLQPYVKQYAQDEGEERIPVDSWWDRSRAGTNKDGKRHLKQLFPDQDLFATPKPESLMARIVNVATDPGDIVLDCFAGSGTTAATAHKLARRWVTCELSRATVDNFVIPRLRAVVDGSDQGGITLEESTRFAADNPVNDALTPEQAVEFNKTLRLLGPHLASDENGLLKQLRELTKTVTVKEANWSGGGGFTFATLSPRMYDVIDDDVVLTDAAMGPQFAEHVAAQLNFRLTSNPRFTGQRGHHKLAVRTEIVYREDIQQILDDLGNEESALVVAAGFDESARDLADAYSSRIRLVRSPDYLDSWRASRAYL